MKRILLGIVMALVLLGPVGCEKWKQPFEVNPNACTDYVFGCDDDGGVYQLPWPPSMPSDST